MVHSGTLTLMQKRTRWHPSPDVLITRALQPAAIERDELHPVALLLSRHLVASRRSALDLYDHRRVGFDLQLELRERLQLCHLCKEGYADGPIYLQITVKTRPTSVREICLVPGRLWITTPEHQSVRSHEEHISGVALLWINWPNECAALPLRPEQPSAGHTEKAILLIRRKPGGDTLIGL